MKKIMISLMLVVAATTTSFAKSNNTDVANAVKSVAEQVKQAPSGQCMVWLRIPSITLS